MRYSLIVGLILLLVAGCADHDAAKKTLYNAALTDVETFSIYDPNGVKEIITCGNGDWWITEFKAKNKDGENIVGVVCSGIFKGNTIRYGNQ